MTQKELFKLDSKGKIRTWKIQVISDFYNLSKIIIESGLIGGKLVKQVYPITEGKNIGRANETSVYQQAVSEAQSRIASQIKDGYVESLVDLKESGTKGSGIPGCMLAKTYDPSEGQSGSKSLKKLGLLNKHIIVQKKYDGVRRTTLVNESTVEMYTRSGDRSETLPHIENQLRKLYDSLNLQGDIWLDGEAYTSELTFNEINGITRRGVESEQDIARREMIQYHIYDIISSENYMERYERLIHFKSENVIPVESLLIVATEDKLKELHDQFVLEGYEGLMIRTLETGYESKRSKSLLKYKAFEDANFKIIGVNPTKDGSRAATFVLEMDKVTFDSDGKLITEFEATIVAPHKELEKFLSHKDDAIGRMAKINFFGRSEYGVPRFPRAKGFVFNQ